MECNSLNFIFHFVFNLKYYELQFYGPFYPKWFSFTLKFQIYGNIVFITFIRLNTTITQIYISPFFHNLYYFCIFNLFIYFLRIYILYYSFLKCLNIALNNTKYSICFKEKKNTRKINFIILLWQLKKNTFHIHLQWNIYFCFNFLFWIFTFTIVQINSIYI